MIENVKNIVDQIKWLNRPLTNADRIRAMTDEELARKLYDVSWKVAISPNEIDTEEDWLDWLRQEVNYND